jgi:pimeloyl-ACP methyl ester carboxylesterase
MRIASYLFFVSVSLLQGQFEAWLTREAEGHWARREFAIQGLSTAAEIRERQGYVRRTMLELIGGLPTEKTPLNARVTGSFAREGYRVENVIFESEPGFQVTANLYLPTVGQGPFPAILGVAGHSVNGKASATYQAAFIGFVRQGFAVLAFDPPGQGERLEYLDPETGRSRPGAGVAEHNMAGLQTLLTGQTLARYFVWDGIRAFDYLLTRPEIDPRRIAVAGNSGGGTQAAYLAVFEPRLAAVVSSCYMTRWRELWAGPGPQDAEQVFPGFVQKGLDFGDFALAYAPRPFLMTTAIRDYFPIAGARMTDKQNQRLFDLLGQSEKAGYFEFDDTHGWSQPRREAAVRFLAKSLQGRETEGREANVDDVDRMKLLAETSPRFGPSGLLQTVCRLFRVPCARMTFARIS